MKLASQLITIALLWVALFGAPDVSLPALPDWITSIITIGEPAPIKLDGLRVLIFEETADRGTLTAGQREALLSTAAGSVRDYAQTHCVKINGQPEFRLIDKDSDLSQDTEAVQMAGKLPRPSLPWLVVSNGKRGFSGPLPETAADTLSILKKYGGE